MSLLKDSIAQLKLIAPVFKIIYPVLLGVLILIGIICGKYNIPLEMVTRDPARLANFNPFTGVLSNIGILIWCSAAAICFFASAIHSKKGDAKVATYLLFSGLLSSLLLLDDLFMFHESIFPKYLHIPEKIVYVGYLALVSMYLLKFRSMILQNEYMILVFAFGFFGLSIFCDGFLPQEGMEFLVEDGLKMFGIVTWFIFYTRTSFFSIRKLLKP